MEVTTQDDEDNYMGFVDIAELIKKINQTNEIGETVENLDGLDSLESELELQSIEEPSSFITFTISPNLILSILLVGFILIVILIYNSTKCLKLLLKCGKTYNQQLNQLLVGEEKKFGDDGGLNKSSLSGKSFETSITSSGSESGIGLFPQSTISNTIDFITQIESGSFGRVWVCNYRGQACACRVYGTIEQNLWQHESKIQKELKNSELVGIICSDVQNDPITCDTRFLIITDYYHNGSLYHFLKSRQIDEVTMINLIHSIARGLHYLHATILGNPDKLAVIHFNLKSRNIMVDYCGSRCLISDFSNACSYDKNYQISESPTFFHFNNDSYRYRAPELLTTNQVPNDLQLARACDVYSFSLIIWEIATRCILPVSTSEPVNRLTNYQLPYDEELNYTTPNQQTMNQLVNVNNVRPKINPKWSTVPTLTEITQILIDSWTSSPLSRLTAFRIMKNLEKLRDNLETKDNQKINFSSIEIIS